MTVAMTRLSNTNTTMKRLFVPQLLLLAVALSYDDPNSDRFNYGESDFSVHDYGPRDWGRVRCESVDQCTGWPTNWEDINGFIPYEGTANMCRDCSSSSKGRCHKHRQSPIDLSKGVTATADCVDRHRMRYWAGECDFQNMQFQILPHVLRAYQPEEKCPGEFQPQIDFSKGYPAPWKLWFTDISVPSQHTMDGVSYDAEVVLSHYYSDVENPDRLIGNVSIMLQRGRPKDRYDFLELYLRAWAKTAQDIYNKCLTYPDDERLLSELFSAFEDEEEDDLMGEDIGTDTEYDLHHPRFPEDPSQPKNVSTPYYIREWQPYDWYDKANSEFYFRYEGSMPEPPCIEVVHWRVLSSPVKVSPAQLRVLHYLLKNRIDPDTCEFRTAAILKSSSENEVCVNRPVQTTSAAHRLVYCECSDWKPSGDKDKAFCKLSLQDRGVFPLVRPAKNTP